MVLEDPSFEDLAVAQVPEMPHRRVHTGVAISDSGALGDGDEHVVPYRDEVLRGEDIVRKRLVEIGPEQGHLVKTVRRSAQKPTPRMKPKVLGDAIPQAVDAAGLVGLVVGTTNEVNVLVGHRLGSIAPMNAFADPEIDLAPDQVAELLERDEIELIDVREPYEREAGYIEGSRHIELERLAGRAATIPRDRPVVFQCRLGARSAMAAQAFRSAGWDARNLAGGISAWVDAGLPIEPEGGRVAEH